MTARKSENGGTAATALSGCRADKKKKPTVRKCIATGALLPKSAMIRFCLSPDNKIVPDLAGTLPAKGIWVSADKEAVAAAVREFAEHAPAPEDIRAAALEKMERHRQTFRDLLNEAMSPKKLPDRYAFPHKLLLRRIGTPVELHRFGLRRSS